MSSVVETHTFYRIVPGFSHKDWRGGERQPRPPHELLGNDCGQVILLGRRMVDMRCEGIHVSGSFYRNILQCLVFYKHTNSFRELYHSRPMDSWSEYNKTFISHAWPGLPFFRTRKRQSQCPSATGSHLGVALKNSSEGNTSKWVMFWLVYRVLYFVWKVQALA